MHNRSFRSHHRFTGKHKMVDFGKEDLDWKNRFKTHPHYTDQKYQLFVSPLTKFAEAISKHLRGVKFAFKDKNSLYVFMPNETLCMGWIGYGDFLAVEDTNQYSWVVYSRCIQNWKYHSGRDQRHMSMSINMDTAIRNAKKYLRNYSTEETSNVEWNDMLTLSRKSYEDSKAKLDNEIRRSMQVSTNNPANDKLFGFLREVVNSNFVISDIELRDTLVKIFTDYDEHMSMKTKQINMDFVRVYERMGKRRFDVLPMGDITKDEP